MNIVVVHNHYRLRGGEDVVFESEVKLLSNAGHVVHPLSVSNNDVRSLRAKAGALLGTAHNRRGIAMVLQGIKELQPDLVHFHNTFPLFSPAVYRECQKVGVAVVQTLHNFRPICIGSFLFRDGHDCHLCLNGSSLPGVLHRCYRNSFVASAAAARMVSVHRARGTWCSDVDRYIALTEFAKEKFAQAGFPAERIEIKPNFADDPGPSTYGNRRSGVLYVGRLSAEKGTDVLVRACKQLQHELRIVGTGPELSALREQCNGKVTFLGALDRGAVLREMQRARFLVVPSVVPEGFPVVVAEAFACGTPVIASRLGSLSEIIEDGVTGALFPPGDAIALERRLALLLSNPELTARLGDTARRVFLERYAPEVNLRRLEDIYGKALRQNPRRNRSFESTASTC